MFLFVIEMLANLKSLVHLVYPNCCIACGEALSARDTHVCIPCMLELPQTGFHMRKNNPLTRVLKGRVQVDSIASYYYFDKGLSVQRMMHAIKYQGKRELAVQIGEWYGAELKQEERFSRSDYIIPVPLHPSRLAVRKYNQSAAFAEGLAASLQVETADEFLVRNTHTASQTRKSRMERWENVEAVFTVHNPEALRGKNIILVDDVITTGATLEACAQVLWQSGIRSLSIVTMACALKI